MDGIHEMAGRLGFGQINPEPNEPVFHAEWEKTVLTMFPAMAFAGAFNLDQFRHAMEKIAPADYITSTYYEHWMHAQIALGAAAGIFEPAELDKRTQYYLDNPDEPLPPSQTTDLKATLESVIPEGLSCIRESDKEPAFTVGDRVRVLQGSPKSHTRRPSYLKGKSGEVVLAHGTYVYPDSNAQDKGENPEHVYTVRFTAHEVWGDEGVDGSVAVHCDFWEPYLERV